MRICLLTEYFDPDGAGGTPSVLPALARELTARYADVEIDVLTSRNVYRGDRQLLPDDEEWAGMRIHRLHTPRSNQTSTPLRLAAGWLFTRAALTWLLKRPSYDLLFVGTNPPAAPMAAQGYQRLRGVPYVYLIHDLFPDIAVALRSLRAGSPVARQCHRLQKGWLKGAARVVVIGRCMQRRLARKYGIAPHHVDVIPNWADPMVIHPLPRETVFRELYGLTDMVVLYAGNLGRHQDFTTLLDAAHLMRIRDPRVTFVFVGDGAKRAAIVERITWDWMTNVRLCPFVPSAQLADLLASADLSLVTLERGAEGLGVPSKFYNILASGRPTVALVDEHSEVAQVLAEADCGLRVDPGDATGLAAAIGQLANDAPARARLGRNARAVLEERFTLETIAARYHALFTEVAAEHGAFACVS